MSAVRRQPAAAAPTRCAAAGAAAVEVFTLGTRLTRVTRRCGSATPSARSRRPAHAVPDWSGGTRLGEALQAFLDRWGQRGMARGAVVVVFSDGWERGDRALLGEQMRRLRAAGAPGRLGQPAPRQAGLRSRCRRGSSPRCRTLTTSSPGTAWRPSRSSWRWSAVRDVLAELLPWWRAGETVGVGTVVATFRSAPRPAGAAMLVGPGRRGGRLGVAAAASRARSTSWPQQVVADGAPVLQRYGVSDDDAFAVGLTCGGILDVFVELVEPRDLPRARRGRRRHRGRPPGRGRHRRSSTPTRPGSAAGWSSGPRTDAGAGPRGRWARPGPTTRSPTTRAACSPPGAPRR